MEQLPLDESTAPIEAPLLDYYHDLCQNSTVLIHNSEELLGVTCESSRTSPSDSTPLPSTQLVTYAASKLTSLLHPPGGAAGRDMKGIETLSQLMAYYCCATTQLPDGNSVGSNSLGGTGTERAASQGSSGRNTPNRPAARLRQMHNATPNHTSSYTPWSHHLSTRSHPGGGGHVYGGGSGEAPIAEEMFRASTDAVVCVAGDLSLPPTARLAALHALTSSLRRFRAVPFNATRHLASLFPEVDATRCGVGQAAAVHPLLTPLLWEASAPMRAAAAGLIVALLHKLHESLQYAEEPQTQRRQSFASLASQCGRALNDLHDALLWALQQTQPAVSRKDTAARSDKGNDEGGRTWRGLMFALLAALLPATPYRRCPHACGKVRLVLELPSLRAALERGSGTDFAPAAAFFAQCLRSTALAAAAPLRLESDGLLGTLLPHAATRAEVWGCILQLARTRSQLVATHFDVLMHAAAAVLRGGVERTMAECLAAWLQYMGYVWHAFDGQQTVDPAGVRASGPQRARIVRELVLPVLARTEGNKAHRLALRCLAQVGDACLRALTAAEREDTVGRVVASTMAWDYAVRAEAFTTIGVWAWQYTAFAEWLPEFVERAAGAACDDEEPLVRFKAAFALSNVTSRFKDTVDGTGDAETQTTTGDHSDDKEPNSSGSHGISPLRQSSRHMQLLCDVAMHLTQIRDDPAVAGHGIRMMSHLLSILTIEELIAELNEPQFGVAEGYFTALLRFLLPSNRDAKLRWNAAFALGLGLSREETFEAEPKLTMQAVERLCVVVRHDRIFKVRTQAAGALAKVPMECLAAGRYDLEDRAPKVTRALCEALQASRGATDSFAQYKEQDALCKALRDALLVVITRAAPSEGLQNVFAEYRTLLTAQEIL